MFSVLVCIVASVTNSEGGTTIELPQNLRYVSRNLGIGIPQFPVYRPQNLRIQTPQRLTIPQTLPLGIPNQYAINSALLKDQLLPRVVNYAVQDVPEKEVSYSLSYQDYEFLKQHKVHGQDSPYNPDPTDQSTSIDYLPGKHDHSENRHNYRTPEQNHGKRSHDHEKRSDDHNKEQNHGVPYLDGLIKRSTSANLVNEYNIPHVKVPLEPVVHKHVYFHVPPPEFEDESTAPQPIQPHKKNVNIVFIKAPSYESNFAYQQQPVETKTLIYVLSKKEDSPQPVVLPPSSPPEVFFVNYKFSPNDITSINNDLSLPSLLENISPITDRQERKK